MISPVFCFFIVNNILLFTISNSAPDPGQAGASSSGSKGGNWSSGYQGSPSNSFGGPPGPSGMSDMGGPGMGSSGMGSPGMGSSGMGGPSKESESMGAPGPVESNPSITAVHDNGDEPPPSTMKVKNKQHNKIKGLKIETASAGGNCQKSKIQMGAGVTNTVNINGSSISVARSDAEC